MLQHKAFLRIEYPSFNFRESTERLLKKYGWKYRNDQDGEILPFDILDSVQKQIQLNILDDESIEVKGDFPYISFANLQGMKNDIMTKDDDSVIGIVAPPGKGKSTVGLMFCKFIDKTFNPRRVIFTMKQLKAFLSEVAKDFKTMTKADLKSKWIGCAVLCDEGVYMLFSGDSQSKNGKDAQKLFSIIRALNLIFVVCITNWRKISKGVKEDRFKGVFRVPNKGHLIYHSPVQLGQVKYNPTGISWPKPSFYENVGYLDHDCQFWKEYSTEKSNFLGDATEEAVINE